MIIRSDGKHNQYIDYTTGDPQNGNYIPQTGRLDGHEVSDSSEYD
jgi:hypothetical protein